MSKNSTRISIHMNAPRERVYNALVDANAIATWMVPTGMTSHVHAFEGREGGCAGYVRRVTHGEIADAIG
jgi:uncharacterized protein YndB with AHSA1/START domain